MSKQQAPNHDRRDGRLMMGVGGVLFIPLSAALTWFLLGLPRPQGFIDLAVRILLDELAIGATLFFSVGFLWALSGHRRLKRLLDAAAVKFAWILIPLAVSGFVAAACVLLFG
jgi:hypothetical protein